MVFDRFLSGQGLSLATNHSGSFVPRRVTDSRALSIMKDTKCTLS